jgi:hypothetical protein
MLESSGSLSVFVGSLFTRFVSPRLPCMLAQLVLADFGVSHQLRKVVEDLGPSAVSAAGREGTSLTGECRLCVPKRYCAFVNCSCGGLAGACVTSPPHSMRVCAMRSQVVKPWGLSNGRHQKFARKS